MLLQGIEEMTTDCCVWLVVSWPLGGLNDTLVPVGADQLRFPGEVSPTVTVQVYVPSLFCGQLLEVGSIFCGAKVICGSGVGEGGGGCVGGGGHTTVTLDVFDPVHE